MKDIWMEKARIIVDDFIINTKIPIRVEPQLPEEVLLHAIAIALEEVARERDKEIAELKTAYLKYLKKYEDCKFEVERLLKLKDECFDTAVELGKQKEDLQKQLSEKEEELRLVRRNYDCVQGLLSEKEAEISRLKMLTDFPESSFKWRWAKAEEKIKELENLLKSPDLLQKLEKAVGALKEITNLPDKADAYDMASNCEGVMKEVAEKDLKELSEDKIK